MCNRNIHRGHREKCPVTLLQVVLSAALSAHIDINPPIDKNYTQRSTGEKYHVTDVTRSATTYYDTSLKSNLKHTQRAPRDISFNTGYMLYLFQVSLLTFE